MQNAEPTLSDAIEASRYEARVDGELAGFIDYRRHGTRLILVHTETLPAFEGRGIASALARYSLGGARDRGDLVSIRCPYLATFVERYPEFAPGPDQRIPPLPAA
jgi:predicted GNAT family acetyltransferase